MALALYRKYRPTTFADVIGQDHVTQPLMQAIANGRINHAYLFSGPRGCGKTSSARILARSLNCEAGPTPNPCGQCTSCRELANDGPGSLDVIEIDAASHGGVDDARDLRERAFFAPVNSRYKIYIVDEAHMVSTQGFNALLKLVEEPPEFLLFIFATTEPDKVLPTIRSRTHHYPFRLIPPGVLKTHLEQICSVEGITVAEAVFPLVVRAGGGSARDSLSLLDQLLAGAGPEGVTYQRAVALLGVTDAALLDDIIDALAANDSAAVYTTVDRVVEAGHDPRRFATDLLERLRDLVLINAVPDAVHKGLLDGSADQLERMVDQANRLGIAMLSRFADIVHNGLIEMRGTTAPRLLLELICARMLLPAVSGESAAFLQRLERLERRNSIAAPPVAAPVQPNIAVAETPPASEQIHSSERKYPVSPAQPAPVPASTPPSQPSETPKPAAIDRSAINDRPDRPQATVAEQPAGASTASNQAIDAVAVRRQWDQVMDGVKRQRRATHALLMNVTVIAVEDGTLVLSATSGPLARLVSESVNVDILRNTLHDVFGVNWSIRCDTTPSTKDSSSSVPPEPSTSDTDFPAVKSPEVPSFSAVDTAETTATPTPMQQVPPVSDGAPAQIPETPNDDADHQADGSNVVELRPASNAKQANVGEFAVALLREGLGAERITDPER